MSSAKDFKERMEDFDYFTTPIVFNLSLTLNTNMCTIEEIYGVPSDSKTTTGQVINILTLFASRTENGETKGGVILLKIKCKVPNKPIEITTTWENEIGMRESSSEMIEINSLNAPVYDNKSIQKAILLARYGSLLKEFAEEGTSVAIRHKMERFSEYFEREMELVEDKSLEQELDILHEIAQEPDY